MAAVADRPSLELIEGGLIDAIEAGGFAEPIGVEGFEPFDGRSHEDDRAAPGAEIESACDEPEPTVAFDGFARDAPAIDERVDGFVGLVDIGR